MKDHQVLKQLAQRRYGNSILVDGHSSTGHGPKQPALMEPALSRKLGCRLAEVPYDLREFMNL